MVGHLRFLRRPPVSIVAWVALFLVSLIVFVVTVFPLASSKPATRFANRVWYALLSIYGLAVLGLFVSASHLRIFS